MKPAWVLSAQPPQPGGLGQLDVCEAAHLCHGRLSLGIFRVGVDVQGHRHIRVAHQVLQTLQIHPGVGHVGAEGVAKYVGADLGQGDHMGVVVLFPDPADHVLDVQGYLGTAVLIQQQEARVAVHHPFLPGPGAVGKDVQETSHHVVIHGNEAAAGFGLGFLHIPLAAAVPDQLMIHPDPAVLEVQVADGQAAELADPHTGAQQHDDLIQVLAAVVVLGDEIQELLLLPFRQGRPPDRVVGQEVQAEVEGVPPDDLLGEGHLEGGPQHTPDGCDGVPGIAVIKKLDEPFLGVADPEVPDDPVAEVVLVKDPQDEAVARLGVVADVSLLSDVALHQIDDRDVSLGQVDAHGGADQQLRFLLPKLLHTGALLHAQGFAGIQLVHLPAELLQGGGIDAVAIVVLIRVAVVVGAVLALTLSRSQETALAVFSFCCVGFSRHSAPF